MSSVSDKVPTSELPGVAEIFIDYRPRPALLVGGFLLGAGAVALFTFFSTAGASAPSG